MLHLTAAADLCSVDELAALSAGEVQALDQLDVELPAPLAEIVRETTADDEHADAAAIWARLRDDPDADLADELTDADVDRVRESARERIVEMPLGVSSRTVFVIEMSTGGPADQFEVICRGSHPRYVAGDDPFEVERIVYRFSDWFDQAEDELSGADLAAAEAFARHVIPELAD